MQKLAKNKSVVALVTGLFLALFIVQIAQLFNKPQCPTGAYRNQIADCIEGANTTYSALMWSAAGVALLTVLIVTALIIRDINKATKRQRRASADSAEALLKEAKKSAEKK